MKLKEGDYIEAIRDGYMNKENDYQQFSTKGKIYEIICDYGKDFEIIDDNGDEHMFSYKWLNKTHKNYYFRKIDIRELKLKRILNENT